MASTIIKAVVSLFGNEDKPTTYSHVYFSADDILRLVGLALQSEVHACQRLAEKFSKGHIPSFFEEIRPGDAITFVFPGPTRSKSYVAFCQPAGWLIFKAVDAIEHLIRLEKDQDLYSRGDYVSSLTSQSSS